MLKEIDTSACVLFLGSGFSADGKNILGLGPPVGDRLRKDLVDLLDDPSYENHDLQIVSEAASDDPNVDLYQELYNRYTITDVPPDQEYILRLPWRRIYTTNYDDAIERVLPGRPTFNYDEERPRRIPEGAVVHLHGAIRATTPDNVLQQLVLGERSYVRQHLERSPWYNEFDRDVRFSDGTFFLGYSLKDQHITAFLMKNPATVPKVFFVTRDQPDKPTATKLGQYGRILPIGITGFASLLKVLPKPAASKEPNQLRSLRFLNPLQDKATIVPPTSQEVRNLLTFGSFNFKRMIAGLSDESYVVARAQLIEKAINELVSARTLIVDARLGNGKTVFLNVLAAALSERGYKCFMCRSDAISATRDLDVLRALGKVAILFDSYSLAIDLIQEFAALPEAVFVVAVRTSVREVQMHEILNKCPSPLSTISVNALYQQERRAFAQLVRRAGLLSPSFEQKVATARDFRELVLTIFDNALVRRTIEQELFPALNNAQVRKVFLVSYLLKQSGHDADAVFLRDVTGVDPYQALFAVEAAAMEVFDLGDQLQLRSALFSSYLVDTFFDASEVLMVVEMLITSSALRREELKFRRMNGALMQVSFLSKVLARLPNPQRSMRDLFERLRQHDALSAEPLFWLQYAILMADEDLGISESFISTAYDRAEARDGFRTYQIDTFALRLALRAETQELSAQIARFDYISEKLNLVIEMLGEPSHRYHAISVLDGIAPFVEARGRFLSVSQKNRLVYDLSRAAHALQDLPANYRAQVGSDVIKERVGYAKDRLLAV
ncbi:MAG: SIR2 family protein [Rhizobium sp.]|nr:SIR2 family protein [Rhizobium sp.]